MQVDIFHDIGCPWCRIGKRNFELALEEWQGEPVEVHYRAFFLNPDARAEGESFHDLMQAKGGGRIPMEQFFAGPRDAGARVGLNFNFEKIEMAPNTMLAHRLLSLAPYDLQAPLLDILYAAYFEDGRDIGKLEVLVELAADAGLDRDTIREQLESDAGADQVLAEVQLAHELQIQGVPFFVFNGRYGVSGAQPAATLLEVLEHTATEAAAPAS